LCKLYPLAPFPLSASFRWFGECPAQQGDLAFTIFQQVCFRTVRAQPEVSHAMGVRGHPAFGCRPEKTEEPSPPEVEGGGAIRIDTSGREHQPHSARIHQSDLYPLMTVQAVRQPVKRIKSMERIKEIHGFSEIPVCQPSVFGPRDCDRVAFKEGLRLVQLAPRQHEPWRLQHCIPRWPDVCYRAWKAQQGRFRPVPVSNAFAVPCKLATRRAAGQEGC